MPCVGDRRDGGVLPRRVEVEVVAHVPDAEVGERRRRPRRRRGTACSGSSGGCRRRSCRRRRRRPSPGSARRSRLGGAAPRAPRRHRRRASAPRPGDASTARLVRPMRRITDGDRTSLRTHGGDGALRLPGRDPRGRDRGRPRAALVQLVRPVLPRRRDRRRPVLRAERLHHHHDAVAHAAAGYGAFLRRRVVRLYPALLGLVARRRSCSTPWSRAAPTDPVEVARRGVVVLTQTSSLWAAEQDGSLWLPGLQPFGQTWSLAVEWYFYLLWPVVVLAARRRGWSRPPAGRGVAAGRRGGVRRSRCRSRARSGSTSARPPAARSCWSVARSRCTRSPDAAGRGARRSGDHRPGGARARRGRGVRAARPGRLEPGLPLRRRPGRRRRRRWC